MKNSIIMDEPGDKKLVVNFDKEGEEKQIFGLVLGEKKGDYNLEVVVDHRAPDTKGRVEVRGIARGGAQVSVTGTIKIDKGAQKVDDFLELRLLILDDKSGAVAEPKLEIEANDVRASHAASVGRLDEDQIYYLMSRGIGRKRSEGMLVDGFLGVVREKIKKG